MMLAPARAHWCLALVIAALLAVNLVTAFLDKTPNFDDAGRNLHRATCYRNALAYHEPVFSCLMAEGYHKPDAWVILGGLLIYPFDAERAPSIALLAEQLFFAALLIAVFTVARRLAPDEPPTLALLAALVTGAAPLMFGLSKKFMGDVPLTALVWISLALLPATDRFHRRGMSLALGLALGAGLMMRQTFALFLFGPLLVAAVLALREKAERGRSAQGLALAALPALALPAPWYTANFVHSFIHYRDMGENIPTSWTGFLPSFDYLRRIAAEQLGWVLAALAVVGLGRILWGKPMRERYGRLLLSAAFGMAVPYLFFSGARVHLARYLLPLAPAFALAATFGLAAGVDSRWRRRGIMMFVAGWCAFQFTYMSVAPRVWRPHPPLLERVLGYPDYRHRPGDTHVGRFGIDRLGFADGAICRGAAQIQHDPVRLLVATDKTCAALTSFHGAKWCLMLDPFYTQMMRVTRAADLPPATLEAAKAWPNLLLLSFDDLSLLNDARRRFGLAPSAGWRLLDERRYGDGWSALYRNVTPVDGAAPPPTIAAPGDCVAIETCRNWCVKMGAEFEEK
jgi:hypothetical protein